MATTTIRDLRNRFPKVKELVETEGEVIITDNGQPKYMLTLYTPVPSRKAVGAKDYMARLRQHQVRPIPAATAKALLDDNRGKR
jgi:antitoxin (DNA-binding transcriptional repressor) of toxin-antitoxin stability system